MNRRNAVRGMAASALAAVVPLGLTGIGQKLNEIWQWDFVKGGWFRVRMKDLHEHDLFTMVGPDGQGFNEGSVYWAMSEPALDYPDDSLRNQPTWGIDAREAGKGNPQGLIEWRGIKDIPANNEIIQVSL